MQLAVGLLKLRNYIEQAWINLTYSCNNRCKWCYNFNPIENTHIQSNNISLNECKKVFSFLKRAQVRDCALVGGEPTLYPHLLRLIDYANKIDLHLSIVTNGRAFANASFVKTLHQCQPLGISISVEGSNHIIHDNITGVKNSFNETYQGIINCLKQGLKFSTITTISKSNISDLQNIVKLLLSIGRKHIAFNFCIPSLSNPSSFNETLSFQELSFCISCLVELCNENNIRITFVTPIPHCKLEGKVLQLISDKKVFLGNCHMFFGTGIIVDYNLDILPCTHLQGVRLGSLKTKNGNIISASSFNRLWKKVILHEFRDKLWRYSGAKCINCNRWENCMGGCPLFWLKWDGAKELALS